LVESANTVERTLFKPSFVLIAIGVNIGALTVKKSTFEGSPVFVTFVEAVDEVAGTIVFKV